MYPFYRLFINQFKSNRQPKFENPFIESKIKMRVWISDIDLFMEMNNGRFLTLMDIGRFDVGIRTGLFKILKKHNWGLMVGAVSTRYRYRLRTFQKFTLHTKLTHYDERWFYFHQWFEGFNGRKHASFLVRTAVISSNGLVPTKEVVAEMNYNEDLLIEKNKKSEWIEKWIESDELHKIIMEGESDIAK